MNHDPATNPAPETPGADYCPLCKQTFPEITDPGYCPKCYNKVLTIAPKPPTPCVSVGETRIDAPDTPTPLTDSFNRLTSELQNRIADLERALAEAKNQIEELLIKNNRLADAADKAEFHLVQERKEIERLKADKERLDLLEELSRADGPLGHEMDRINEETQQQKVRFIMLVLPYEAEAKPDTLRAAIDLCATQRAAIDRASEGQG